MIIEKPSLRAALFEGAFVTLGVLLALLANEWAQSRASKKQAKTALAAITEELRSNRKAVAASLAYHEQLALTLRSGKQDQNWKPTPATFSRGFISPAETYHTAWDSASQTGAFAHLPYDKVLELSKVYALQENYREQARTSGQIIYAELYRGGMTSMIDNYRNLAIIIHTFTYRERQLLERYDEVLK